jgi:NADH:ubiquinone oxidoreductase subunit 2 (subunit N)
VLNALSVTNIFIAIIAVLTSVIGCVRYLNIIQISNFKLNNLSTSKEIRTDSISSYIIAIFTTFLSLSFIKPIYLVSKLSFIL